MKTIVKQLLENGDLLYILLSVGILSIFADEALCNLVNRLAKKGTMQLVIYIS